MGEQKQDWRDEQKEYREWCVVLVPRFLLLIIIRRQEMRSRFPSSIDDTTLRRFFTARQGDADAASAMLESSLRWRRAYGCPVDPHAIAHQLSLGNIFTAGTAKFVEKQGFDDDDGRFRVWRESAHDAPTPRTLYKGR
jgi:hypothetical protein